MFLYQDHMSLSKLDLLKGMRFYKKTKLILMISDKEQGKKYSWSVHVNYQLKDISVLRSHVTQQPSLVKWYMIL